MVRQVIARPVAYDQTNAMASIRKQIVTAARPELVWDAIRDIGALHTRLVPGFVVDTRLEPGARIVTFANGAVVKEPIVTIDEEERRLVWSAQGGVATHYNASVQVFSEGAGSRVVWRADFLPHEAEKVIGPMMEQGIAAMQKALDRLS
jgi:carbon monoxide dehydrogenase subunit G